MLRHFLIDPLIPESAPWRCEQGAFCTCHANCLNALGAGILEACLGRGVYMPSIKTFLDDTTIILSRKQIVQRVLNKLNDLIHWCCMVLKPEKSRSLIRDKICRNMRWIFDELLCDKNQKAPIAGKILDTCWSSGLIQSLASTICSAAILTTYDLRNRITIDERNGEENQSVNRKWPEFPLSISSIALYSRIWLF